MAYLCEYYNTIDLVTAEPESTSRSRHMLSRVMSVSAHVAHLMGYSRTMEMCGVFVLVVFMLTGCCLQVIALNFWLQYFPEDRSPGNYTVLAVSSTIFSLFFLCIAAVHIAIHRPCLRFLRHARGWLRLIGIGTADMLNSVLAIYAASYTTEVLQALFVALVPIYTSCLARLMLKDRRRYRNGLLLTSFALLLVGVGMTTVWMMTHSGTNTPDENSFAAAPVPRNASLRGAACDDYTDAIGSCHEHMSRDVLTLSRRSCPAQVGHDSERVPIRVHMRASAFTRVLPLSSASSSASTAWKSRWTYLSRMGVWAAQVEKDNSDSSNTNSSSDTNHNSKWWAFVFFISVPMSVLMNIGQTLYMIRYVAPHNDNHNTSRNDDDDNTDEDCDDVAARGATTAQDVVIVDATPESDDLNRAGAPPRQRESPPARKASTCAHTFLEGACVEEKVVEHEESPLCARESVNDTCKTCVVSPNTTHRSCHAQRNRSAPYHGSSVPQGHGSAGRARRSDAVHDKDEDEDVDDQDGEEADNSNASCQTSTAMLDEERPWRDVYESDDTTVKIVMLAAGTTVQCLGVLLLLPMDALPWFGRSASVSQAYRNFFDGIDCVLHCPHNMIFCSLYSLGFVLVYVCATYLNQYSVTLCSMVTQIASPTTALLLVVFPSLNVTLGDGADAPWLVSLCSVACLVAGAFMYTLWDVQTSDAKLEGEVRLRREMIRHERSLADVEERAAAAATTVG